MSPSSADSDQAGPGAVQRRALAELLKQNPGCHLRGLQRLTDLGLGHLRHHLRVLEAEGLIVHRRVGGRLCYYWENQIPLQDQALHAALYQEVQRRILTLLAVRPRLHHADLVRELGRPPATISYHVGRLRVAGLIRTDSVNETLDATDLARLRKVLADHPQTHWDKVAARFLAGFEPLLD